MREFLCVCVSMGRQFIFDIMAIDVDDAYNKCEDMGYECYSISELND